MRPMRGFVACSAGGAEGEELIVVNHNKLPYDLYRYDDWNSSRCQVNGTFRMVYNSLEMKGFMFSDAKKVGSL